MQVLFVTGDEPQSLMSAARAVHESKAMRVALAIEEAPASPGRWPSTGDDVVVVERVRASGRAARDAVKRALRTIYVLPFRVPATMSATQLRALKARHSPASFWRITWFVDLLGHPALSHANVIHCGNAESGRRIALLKAIGELPSRLICSFSRADLDRYGNPRTHPGLVDLLTHTDFFVVHEEELRGRLLAMGIAAEQIHVLALPVKDGDVGKWLALYQA